MPVSSAENVCLDVLSWRRPAEMKAYEAILM